MDSIMFFDRFMNDSRCVFEGDPGEVLVWLNNFGGNYSLGSIEVHRESTLQRLPIDEYKKEVRFELVHNVVKDYVPADQSERATKKIIETMTHYF